MIKTSFLILFMALCVAPSMAQEEITDPKIVSELRELVALRGNAACKMQARRWSGTGQLSTYDYDENGDLVAVIKTNGHVAPQLGMTLDAIFLLPDGTARAYTFVTKTVLYDSRSTLDVAWGAARALGPDSGIKPVPLSKTRIQSAVGKRVIRTGSPAGQWPLKIVNASITRMVARDVPAGLPNAIGGESGSGVNEKPEKPPKQTSELFEFDNLVDIATLAWTWSGLWAGVDNGKYYEIVSAGPVRQKAIIEAMPPRPEGLIEVSAFQDRGLKNGYQNVKPPTEKSDNVNAKPWNPATLNMWYEADDGTGPVDPPPTGLTAAEIEACKQLKAMNVDLEESAKQRTLILKPATTQAEASKGTQLNAPEPAKEIKKTTWKELGLSEPAPMVNRPAGFKHMTKKGLYLYQLTGNEYFKWVPTVFGVVLPMNWIGPANPVEGQIHTELGVEAKYVFVQDGHWMHEDEVRRNQLAIPLPSK